MSTDSVEGPSTKFVNHGGVPYFRISSSTETVTLVTRETTVHGVIYVSPG